MYAVYFLRILIAFLEKSECYVEIESGRIVKFGNINKLIPGRVFSFYIRPRQNSFRSCRSGHRSWNFGSRNSILLNIINSQLCVMRQKLQYIYINNCEILHWVRCRIPVLLCKHSGMQNSRLLKTAVRNLTYSRIRLQTWIRGGLQCISVWYGLSCKKINFMNKNSFY